MSTSSIGVPPGSPARSTAARIATPPSSTAGVVAERPTELADRRPGGADDVDLAVTAVELLCHGSESTPDPRNRPIRGLPVGDPVDVFARLADRLAPSIDAMRQIAANPGLRSLQLASLAWAAADAAYLVGLLVLAHAAGGTAAVAFVAVSRSLPSVVLAPLLIAATGRIPRDRLLRAVLVARVACVVAASAIVLSSAPIEPVYLLAAADAVAAALLRPLRVTLGPALARSPEELVAANVATSTGDSLAGLVGPAVAAALLVTSGIPATFVAGSLVMAAALVAAGGVRPARSLTDASRKSGPPVASGSPGPDRRSGSGFGQLLRLRHARLIVGLFVGQRFVRGMLTVLIVAAAIDVLRIGDSGVGLLTAAVGLGGLAGGAVALGLVGRRRLAPAFLAGLVAWGGGILLSGLMAVPVVAVAALAAAGVGKVVLDVAGFSLLQRTVPAAARSGVFGLLEGLVTAALALGSIGASLLVETIGGAWAIIAAGALQIGLAVLSWPVLRHADDAAIVPERELRLLQGVAMFRPLQLTTIEQLAEVMERVEVATDEVVVRQGDPGDRFYIVDTGLLETIIDEHVVGRLGPGESFGEIALIRDTDRTATVRAIEPSVVAALPREPFLAAVTGHADAFAAADEVVRGRLAGPIARPLERLLGHDQPVDLVRALVDLGALRIAHQPLNAGLPRIAGSTE